VSSGQPNEWSRKKIQGRQILPTESALGGLTGNSQGGFDSENKEQDTHKKVRIRNFYEHVPAVIAPVPKLS
jgi:hypothetical protein